VGADFTRVPEKGVTYVTFERDTFVDAAIVKRTSGTFQRSVRRIVPSNIPQSRSARPQRRALGR
jgi:hypothetical protein